LPQQSFDRTSGIGSVRWNVVLSETLVPATPTNAEMEVDMGFGRGVLFWLLGIPIPIIILLALFWHH
jgi:hypothetical protein